MVNQPPLVCIVDDDPNVLASICELLSIGNFATRCFSSAEELLQSGMPEGARCMIVDIRLSGMTGIELVHRLIAENRGIPSIFITGHGGDDAIAQVSGLRHVWFVEKPFNPRDLLAYVLRACQLVG
jgi:FixJ family two-component response regulator